MIFGFRYTERHEGLFYTLAAPTDERAVTLDLEVRGGGLRFFEDRRAYAEGRITIERFADARRVRGAVDLRLLDEQRVGYTLTFEGDDGEAYTMSAEKDVQLLALADTLTLLPASFHDGRGVEVARATLRFDPRRELAAFLRSWRLSLFSPQPPART